MRIDEFVFVVPVSSKLIISSVEGSSNDPCHDTCSEAFLLFS